MIKKAILIIAILYCFSNAGYCQSMYSDSITYLNQGRPGLKATIFAPDLVSTENGYEFGSVFSTTLDEFYYSVKLNEEWKAEIRCIKQLDNEWTESQKLPLNSKYTYNDPYLSAKGDRLYFVSNQPFDGVSEPKDFDIWYLQRKKGGWSDPINAGAIINSEKDEFYVSIAKNGNMYFVSNKHTLEKDQWNFDVYCSEYKYGAYQEPKRLSQLINSDSFECDPFISPDESFLIFSSSRPGGFGEGDLYISFKNEQNQWTKAVNMGDKINTETHEFCPQITMDGNCFFFTSDADIYWIDANIINAQIKPNLYN